MDLVFDVPPGIGDVAWCYMKVLDLMPQRQVAFRICSDPPQRSLDFVSMFTGIKNLGFGSRYCELVAHALPASTDLSTLQSGQYVLTTNPYLEAGQPLHTVFPKQKTHYHFSMKIDPRAAEKAQHLMRDTPILIGFYCSSHQHRPSNGFWCVEEWVDFISQLSQLIPGAKFIAVGAEYDDKTKLVYETLAKNGIAVRSCLDQPISVTIEVIRRLSYFFAFPSGLGILAGVLSTPCMMWYWGNVKGYENCKHFFNTYADPLDVASGLHINAPYHDVATALTLFKKKGLPHLRINKGFTERSIVLNLRR